MHSRIILFTCTWDRDVEREREMVRSRKMKVLIFKRWEFIYRVISYVTYVILASMCTLIYWFKMRPVGRLKCRRKKKKKSQIIHYNCNRNIRSRRIYSLITIYGSKLFANTIISGSFRFIFFLLSCVEDRGGRCGGGGNQLPIVRDLLSKSDRK